MSTERDDYLYKAETVRNGEREWWDRDPSLIINPQLQKIDSSIPHHQQTAFNNAQSQIISEISGRFSHTFTDRPKNPEDREHLIVLNPVYPGLNQEMFQKIQSKSGDDFMTACRENLPESLRPMAALIGKKLTGKNLHPNFVNLVFVDGNQFPIDQLNFDQRITFFQSQMAKLGAFKNLFINVNPEDPDNPIMSAILATLEGGHPTFTQDHPDRNFAELARRLKVFGSAKEAGEKIHQSNQQLDNGTWANSVAVRNVQEMGHFAGEHGLLAPPVKLEDLVRSKILKRVIPAIARYSQQAEGAIYAYDPNLKIAGVTESGRFGAVKTNLNPDNVVPIKISPEGLFRYKVRGMDIKGQSVEAQEFLHPEIELGDDFEMDGKPLARATFHMHRSVDRNTNGVPVLKQDIQEDPPVGCGVDVMEEISKKMKRKAGEVWEESGRRVPYVITEVPNHGLNVHFMWSKDNQGNIHQNPFDVFMGDIESGDLSFKREIDQV